MNTSNFMHGWMTVIESLATIAIILTAFGLMLGILKPADTLRQVAGILAVAILFMLIPCVVVNAWSGITPWQRAALVVLGLFFVLLRRPRQKKSRGKET